MKKINKNVIVSGISGQDGAYLAKLLLEKNNCKLMKRLNLTQYYGHYLKFNQKKFIRFLNFAVSNKNLLKNKLIFDGVNAIMKIISKS